MVGVFMKASWSLLVFVLLAGCSEQPFQSGTAERIHYRTGPTTSTLLTGQGFKGSSPATETIAWRNPQVALYDNYIVISYPGTDREDRVIPRESLIQVEWKR